MNPMDHPNYEPTYEDLGIDPNNPNEGYYSSDDGEYGDGDSDYVKTDTDTDSDEYDSDYLEEGPVDLTNQRYFPDWQHLPWEDSLNTRFWNDNHGYFAPSHHWAFVGEIVENRSLLRPGFLLCDREGKEVFIVFYLENQAQFNIKEYRIGRTVVVFYAEKRQFVDGQVGIRIEEKSRAKVIPCTLDTLMKADPEAAATSPSCAKCGQTSTILSACSACKTRYCSRECQVSVWKAHKPECAALAQVREWNERDWNDFDNYWC